ncbi:hypothetical protein MMC11_005906 [Xylographa trunciseda]|nr:hypothetical protein [Xylographa trunciseda]
MSQADHAGVGYVVLAVVSLGFASILGLVIQRRYLSSISDIPGPFWASVSTFWQVWHLIKGHIQEDSLALHRKYGHFVRISNKEVSVSHPDAIRALLHTALPKSNWYKIFCLPNHHHQTPMSETDPKRRVERARTVASAYTLSNIIKSEPYIDNAISLLETRLDELANSEKPVEFENWFNYLAFDIVGEVAFSRTFGFLEQGKDVGGAIANSRILTIYVAVMGYFQWLHRLTLGNPLVEKWGLTPNQHIFDTSKRAVLSRQKNPDVRFDMMEQWLQTRKLYPDRLSENEMYGVVNATVGAGADTISTTLQAFWYHLLRHPQYLAKLRAEIDGAASEGKLSKIVSFAEAQQLPFLQACIKETFRYHPAVMFGLPRVVPKGGLTIGSRHFAEGIELSVNPWVIHRSTEFFGPDADLYNPERWLRSENQAEEKNLIHFGAGYNSCPGRNLAQLEVSKVTATMVRDYDVRQIDPTKSWSYEAHFTAVPYGWPCRVTRRDAGKA